jgi:hypothetical protein
LSVKPAVDRLEAALNSQIPLLRLDITSSFGSKYAAQFSVQTVPTLIILNEDSVEVGRFHLDVPKSVELDVFLRVVP